MNAPRISALGIALTMAACLGACSSSHGSTDAYATASPAAAIAADAATPGSTAADATPAGDSSADAYPDWAAAVAPDYPNRIDQSAIGPFFQIDTADDPATVVAWFKAHATGGSWKANDPDAAPEWFYETPNGVHIDIQVNHYPGNLPSAKATKTMIAFTHKNQ